LCLNALFFRFGLTAKLYRDTTSSHKDVGRQQLPASQQRDGHFFKGFIYFDVKILVVAIHLLVQILVVASSGCIQFCCKAKETRRCLQRNECEALLKKLFGGKVIQRFPKSFTRLSTGQFYPRVCPRKSTPFALRLRSGLLSFQQNLEVGGYNNLEEI
jgi:hypothetical protein